MELDVTLEKVRTFCAVAALAVQIAGLFILLHYRAH
jgi:hypothetical protein